MLLKTVLEANEINRNTYNSLERRAGLQFMKEGLVANAKRGDRYTITHAVALGAMLSFQRLGIDAREASGVIDAVYEWLIDVVPPLAMDEAIPSIAPARPDIDPDRTWITISRFERDGGLGWATGREGADTFSPDPPLVKMSVNVGGLVRKLNPRIRAAVNAEELQDA